MNLEKIIVCNGFKRPEYTSNIVRLLNNGFKKSNPCILDNVDEFEFYDHTVKKSFKIGIRMATKKFLTIIFTLVLGISPKKIITYYKEKLMASQSKIDSIVFINTGIKDHIYYWNELAKCLKIYAELKRICPSLDTLNIGGGLPFKSSLNFDYDYSGFIQSILKVVEKHMFGI